ncbi:MAG TPA: proprotein convertase P-domain-containing protein, partial [Bacteroidia bacterium]|nr:proprotein convertase P-domain-containing protein [Bacteroidia bacterium]
MKKIFPVFLAVIFFIPGNSQTYTGGNGPVADFATTDFPLTVSGLSPSNIDSLSFGLETVCVNLMHTWDEDLEIRIVSPDGTVALLVGGQGGSGDNFTNTCFNQYAATAITTASPPFSGTFRPMGPVGLINNGQNGNGAWILRVTDVYPADNGFLLSWSITFGNSPATATPFSVSNLPLVIINTINNQAIPDEPKIMADMGIIFNGNGNINAVTDPFNNYNGKCGIEKRGSSSQMFPKKPFGIELWDSSGTAIDASLL